MSEFAQIIYFALASMLTNPIQDEAEKRDLRAFVEEIPSDLELVVGTPFGEAPLSFEAIWERPMLLEPQIQTDGPYLSWLDYYHLKDGAHFQVGDSFIEIKCASIYATSKDNGESIRADITFYPNTLSCPLDLTQTSGTPSQDTWFSFRYNSQSKGLALSPEFSLLRNHFFATVKNQ